MDREEIVDKLMDHLNMHLTTEAYIGQEPYIRDIFKLFKEAYKNGYCTHDHPKQLTGDVIRDIAVTRIADNVDENKLNYVIGMFVTMWNSWRYAIDNY